MRKVLFVWDNLVKGGSEVAMINLAKNLCNELTIDLLLVEDKNNFVPEDLKPFQKIYIINNQCGVNIFKTVFKSVSQIFKISKSYDYIIVNDTILPNLLSLIFFIFGQRKIILWSHLAKDYFVSVRSKYGIALNKLILRYISYKVVCVSKLAQLSMISYLHDIKEKTTVVYNLIAKPSQIKVHSGQLKKIITIARLSKEKRIDILINAFALVIEDGYPDLYLTIGGYGDELSSLQSLVAELGINDKVEFIGEVRNPYEHLVDNDLFISSSVTETFSISVAEALLCGVPAISTRTGANEMLQDGKFGIVVSVNNVIEMKIAIENLLKNNDLFLDYIHKTKYATKMLDDNIICFNWRNILK